MPKRSSFYSLPPAVQREIERRLVAGGFRGYIQLTDELRARGFHITKSSLHRTGSKIEARVADLRYERLEREGLTEQPKAALSPNVPNLKSIGQRLRFERLRLSLSQTDIAPKIGISIHSYRVYEENKCKPGAKALAKLALFGMDIKWLLIGDVRKGTP